MQHARLYTFTVGVVAGTMLTSLVTHDWCSAVFVCLGFVSMGVLAYFLFRCRSLSPHGDTLLLSTGTSTLLLFATLFVVCIFGASLGAARVGLWLSFNHSGVLNNLVNKKVSISAIVVEEPQMSDSSSKIIVETIPNTASSTAVVTRGRILIIADRYSIVSYGDEIKLYGKIAAPKPIKSDEGDFAYDVYLARQGIFYTMTYPSISIVAHHQKNIVREYLIKIKNNFLGKINELFSAPQSGLLAGLLVTGRSSLSKAEQTLFTQAGLIHIVALSGFNVTIIAQGLMALLIFLPKKLRLIIGALGIVAFVVMTGFGATIVRAGIMALLVITAALVYRTYHVGRALFMAVLLMVLWNPMVVFDISFQLSCIATFAVIFAAPPAIIKYGPYLKFLPTQFKIREIMLGTTVIEIFLLPILLSTSGQISLVTVITNLLILPTLPAVMGVGFLATLVGYVHSMLALPLVALSNLMLEYILIVTNFFARIPFGVMQFKIPEWVVLLMYAGLAFWLWRLQKFLNKNTGSSSAAGAQNISTKNAGSKIDSTSFVTTTATALTSANLERLDNFFRSHSNSSSQKKP